MEKASKKLILFTFLVIASMVIEGGAIAKVEASRVLPAEAESNAEALITTLESTSANTRGAVAKMEASRVVIEGGAIAKVEASRVLPAEAEAVAKAEAEALITILESTLTNTGGAVAKMEASRVLPAEALIKALDIVPGCPFPCSTDIQCWVRTCSRIRCAAIGESTLRRCVFDM